MPKNENPPQKAGEEGKDEGKNKKERASAHLKISEEAKELLKNSRQPGEFFTDTVERLVRQNGELKRGFTSDELKGKTVLEKPLKGENGSLESSLNAITGLFGLTPADIGAIVKEYSKNEKSRLRQDMLAMRMKGRKPINTTKVIGYVCWVVGALGFFGLGFWLLGGTI